MERGDLEADVRQDLETEAENAPSFARAFKRERTVGLTVPQAGECVGRLKQGLDVKRKGMVAAEFAGSLVAESATKPDIHRRVADFTRGQTVRQNDSFMSLSEELAKSMQPIQSVAPRIDALLQDRIERYKKGDLKPFTPDECRQSDERLNKSFATLHKYAQSL